MKQKAVQKLVEVNYKMARGSRLSDIRHQRETREWDRTGRPPKAVKKRLVKSGVFLYVIFLLVVVGAAQIVATYGPVIGALLK